MTENGDRAEGQPDGGTAPDSPTSGVPEVASHAVAMLLALGRKLVLADRYVRQGWLAGGTLSPAPMPPVEWLRTGRLRHGSVVVAGTR